MKKFIIILVVLLLFLLCSCVETSIYETLSERQKDMVNTIMKNEYLLGDTIKFTEYNGKLYLRTYDTIWTTNSSGFEVGKTVNEKLYVLETTSLTYVPNPDIYIDAHTTYGPGSIPWDSELSNEKKIEKLSTALKYH